MKTLARAALAVAFAIGALISNQAAARADGACYYLSFNYAGLLVPGQITFPICNSAGQVTTTSAAGGGAFPYDFTASQTGQSASFLGIAGWDGSKVQPVKVATDGSIQTHNDGSFTFQIPTTGIGATPAPAAPIVVVQGAGPSAQPVLIRNADPPSTYVPAAGVYNSTPPTLTTGTQSILQLDANGYQFTSVAPGTLGSASGTPVWSRLSDGTNGISSSTLGGDSLSTGSRGLFVQGYSVAFDGTYWDRIRKDTYSAGPQWTSDGGASIVSIPASAGNTVVKGSSGRLARILVTATGTSGDVLCYNNATTNSGTVIADVPGASTAGTVINLQMPASAGVTCSSTATSPVVTVAYW